MLIGGKMISLPGNLLFPTTPPHSPQMRQRHLLFLLAAWFSNKLKNTKSKEGFLQMTAPFFLLSRITNFPQFYYKWINQQEISKPASKDINSVIVVGKSFGLNSKVCKFCMIWNYAVMRSWKQKMLYTKPESWQKRPNLLASLILSGRQQVLPQHSINFPNPSSSHSRHSTELHGINTLQPQLYS